MTDNEIIKAWENILTMGDAPIGEHWQVGITTKLAKETFDMLHRQKAETERLRGVQIQYVRAYFNEFVQRLKSDCSLALLDTDLLNKVIDDLVEAMEVDFSNISDFTALIKSEAYREFAERFKWYVTESGGGISNSLMYSSHGIVNMIDLVFNELTRNLHGTCTESNERTILRSESMKRVSLNIDLTENEVFEKEVIEVIKAKLRENVRNFVQFDETIQKEIQRQMDAPKIERVVHQALYAVVRDEIAKLNLQQAIKKAVDEVLELKLHNFTGKADARCDEILTKLINDKVQEKFRTLMYNSQ